MQVIVATRHGEISDRMRANLESRFAKLGKYESRLSRVEVTLSDEKNRWEVEALASVDRAEPVHARAEAGDVRSAVDRVLDRLARQLKRIRSRHREHQGPDKEDVIAELREEGR